MLRQNWAKVESKAHNTLIHLTLHSKPEKEDYQKNKGKVMRFEETRKVVYLLKIEKDKRTEL